MQRRKRVFRVDLYTKIVLTINAVCMVIICLRFADIDVAKRLKTAIGYRVGEKWGADPTPTRVISNVNWRRAEYATGRWLAWPVKVEVENEVQLDNAILDPIYVKVENEVKLDNAILDPIYVKVANDYPIDVNIGR